MEPSPLPPGVEGAPVKFLLDTNIYDRLLDDPGTRRRLKRIVRAGRVAIVIASAQVSEMLMTKDKEKASRLLEVVGELKAIEAPSTTFYGDPEAIGLHEVSEFASDYHRLQQGKWKESRDAAIATVAKWDSAVLVSDDRPLVARVRRHIPEMWALRWQEFREVILNLSKP